MKKAELIATVEAALAEGGVLGIALMIHMPTGETEIIENPNVPAKLAYIQRAYNDDLVLNTCPDIYIEDFGLVRTHDTMDFGTAIQNLKNGARIARQGWNGKNMYVFLAEGQSIEFTTPADMSEFKDQEVEVSDLMVLRTAQGTLQPGWLATQSDILAEDWYVVS